MPSSNVDPAMVWALRRCRSVLLVFTVGSAALGCSRAGAVGAGAVDPSGRARTWAEEIVGEPVNVEVAVRIPKGSSAAKDRASSLLAGDASEGRLDLLAAFDGASVKGWIVVAPNARAGAFEQLMAEKSSGFQWDATVTLSSGVREACSSPSQLLMRGCLFGFPSGGLVLVGIDAADRARDTFSRSTSAPPALTVPEGLYLSAWSGVTNVSAGASLTADEARLTEGLVGSTFTLDDHWKMTATIAYSDAAHAHDAEEAYRRAVAAAVHDTSALSKLMQARVYDERVDGARLVLVLDMEALAKLVRDTVANAFSGLGAESTH